MLGLSRLVLAATLAAWPLAAAARWHFRAPAPAPDERRARIALRWAALLLMLPWLTCGLVLTQASGSFAWLAGPQALAWLRVVQAQAWLALAGVALAAWVLRTRWRAPATGWWARVHAVLVLLAGLGLAALAVLGHLLSGATNL